MQNKNTKRKYRKTGGVNVTKKIRNIFFNKKVVVPNIVDDSENLNKKINSKPKLKKSPTQKITYNESKYYIGEIKNGKPYGKGVLYENNDTIRSQKWIDGKPTGNGKIQDSNGNTEYVKWDKNGKKIMSRIVENSLSRSHSAKKDELRK